MALKKEQVTAIVIIALLALLGVNAYLLIANRQQKQTIEEKQETISEMEVAMAELDKEYKLALEELEAKKGENEELNQIIEQQQAELKAQKNRIESSIRSGKNSTSELSKARKQIQELIAQKDAYLVRIKELENNLELLKQETVALTSEKEELKTTLAETETKAAEKEKVLTEEKQRLEEEKSTLSDKVAKGSILNARNITVTPAKIKRSGKEDDTKYASKVEKLVVCFDLDKNMVTSSGANKVLVRILTPLGETIYVESQGSGEFANQSEGGKVARYTTSKSFDYNNEAVKLCVDWLVQTPLTKGQYTAEVFNKGYKIGSQTFSLK
jgi:DNA repair exonuclease SbcCD ATPase subunit